LHYVWPSPGLVHYIYTFGISCLLTEFCHVQNCHVQNSLSVRLRTIAQVSRAISSQLRHLSTIGKKLAKQQYVLQMSPQYGELRPTCGWDWSGSLGHPCKFQRVSHLGSITARHSSMWAPAKLCGVEQRAPPIIGRAAITLGIGPHSSLIILCTVCFKCLFLEPSEILLNKVLSSQWQSVLSFDNLKKVYSTPHN